MKKSYRFYIKIEPEIKEQAEEIYARIGLNMPDVVKMMIYKTILENEIPFDLKTTKEKG